MARGSSRSSRSSRSSQSSRSSRSSRSSSWLGQCTKTAILIAVALILLVCILAHLAARRSSSDGSKIFGGAPKRSPRPSSHLVVDTLNLTHWIHGKVALTSEMILATIDKTAATLRQRFTGRVMYVVKDRESVLNDPESRIMYADAAKRNSVYIYAVERYKDPPAAKPSKAAGHSARGRDDMYMALLAHKWRCQVLSEDRFRDFDKFRGEVEPFHVYEFAYWRAIPDRDFVRPDSPAYRTLKKPPAIRYREQFGEPADLQH